MLVSTTSTKGRPFKRKCSSYRKFEFLAGNEIPLSDFCSSRKRKPARVAVPYTTFSSIHQEIFFETGNCIFEVKYLDKYLQRCSFLVKLQASCLQAIQTSFRYFSIIFITVVRHLFSSALLVTGSALWLKKVKNK